MLKVFHSVPWVMPEEPQIIQEFFKKEGLLRKYSKGQMVPPGYESDPVSLISKGLVVFYFLDYLDQQKVFSLSPPRRSVGDLAVLESSKHFAMAECYKDSEILTVSKERYQEFLRSSTEVMEAYAVSANHKHQCVMEGMLSNYTLPLGLRLRQVFYAIIMSYYEVKENDWNPLPLMLTVTELAKVISANRSWASSKLNEWVDEGLIRKDGKLLLIHGKLFEPLKH